VAVYNTPDTVSDAAREHERMGIEVRRGTTEDAAKWAAICFKAFKVLADRHGFEPDLLRLRLLPAYLPCASRIPGFMV
jgi:hypothetical protein